MDLDLFILLFINIYNLKFKSSFRIFNLTSLSILIYIKYYLGYDNPFDLFMLRSQNVNH